MIQLEEKQPGISPNGLAGLLPGYYLFIFIYSNNKAGYIVKMV